MTDEVKYSELCKELSKNNSLDEPLRLEFYKLHEKVKKPNDEALFSHLFDLGFINQLKYQENVRYQFSGLIEEKYILRFLEIKRASKGLKRDLFELYNFLLYENGGTTNVLLPKIPQIVNSDIHQFKSQYCFNNRRKYLFDHLEILINRCFGLYQTKEVVIIVGGGFLDTKESPGDIDLILLMNYAHFRNTRKFQYLKDLASELTQPTEIKPTLDIMKLPKPLDLNTFLAYQQIILLGNDVTEKLQDEIKNFNYCNRKIYQLHFIKPNI
jgi:hypothetical protein